MLEELNALRDSASKWIARGGPWRDIASDAAAIRARFAEAAEFGWHGIGSTAVDGSDGYGILPQLVILEELGAELAPLPYQANSVLAMAAVAIGGSFAARDSLLPAMANGSRISASALPHQPRPLPELTRTNDTWSLTGKLEWMPSISLLDSVVLLAASPQGPRLVWLELDSTGVQLIERDTLDLLSMHGSIAFDGVELAEDFVAGPLDVDVLQQDQMSRAYLASAAEQAGGARKCLEVSLAYAKDRVQFGRAIGSFQAIKHKLAEVLVSVDTARACLYEAGAAMDEGDDDAHALALVAYLYCSEAYRHAAQENIQIHGGVGFTWEHEAHLHYRRAAVLANQYGPRRNHLNELGKLVGLR